MPGSSTVAKPKKVESVPAEHMHNPYHQMDLLRFTTAGSVDDGKSTLIGRLLYDTKSIFEDQLAAIEDASRRRGETGVNLALLTGKAPIGESITYLVDLPLDARGKAPKLKKKDVLLFARAVRGRPGEIQLVSPNAQLLWSEPVEARLRGVLQALVAPDAPARITGVRELLYVPGTLSGQGETQIFLTTGDGSAASITVRHEPGATPAWGVSFSELVAEVGNPPQQDTLEWYRLACFLPNVPPQGVNVSEGHGERRQAEADYRMVIGELGVCRRTLGQGG